VFVVFNFVRCITSVLCNRYIISITAKPIILAVLILLQFDLLYYFDGLNVGSLLAELSNTLKIAYLQPVI